MICTWLWHRQNGNIVDGGLNYDHFDAIEYKDLRSSTARASESALSPGPMSLAPCQGLGVMGVVNVSGIVLLLCTTLLLVPFRTFLRCPSGTGEPSSCILWPKGIPERVVAGNKAELVDGESYCTWSVVGLWFLSNNASIMWFLVCAGLLFLFGSLTNSKTNL